MHILKEDHKERSSDQARDIRRVRNTFPHASECRVCRLLEVPRCAMLDRSSSRPREPVFREFLVAEIEKLIKAHPTYGYRRI